MKEEKTQLHFSYALQVFDYQWFCRVSSTDEKYLAYDEFDLPVFKETLVQKIRVPGEALPINPPPGCWGHGPGPLKTTSGHLRINTRSFVGPTEKKVMFSVTMTSFHVRSHMPKSTSSR